MLRETVATGVLFGCLTSYKLPTGISVVLLCMVTISSCQVVPCELPLGHSGFVQHTTDFWAYDKKSRGWKKTDITQFLQGYSVSSSLPNTSEGHLAPQDPTTETEPLPLHVRKRLSLLYVSEASIWLTGESGSIYERFWNGLQWVVIPHDLPVPAGYATALISVNRTMLALSEAGILHQLQVDSNGQPFWAHCGPWLPASSVSEEILSNVTLIRPGVVSADGGSVFFRTSDGSLAELSALHPPKWVNHGRPRGGDVAAVADALSIRQGVIFSISQGGDLYEFDAKAKPSWKKHTRNESIMQNTTLLAVKGATIYGLAGPSCISLFLLTQNGFLVERRYHQRKWRWLRHSSPMSVHFSAIGPIAPPTSSRDPSTSLFMITDDGTVMEYKLSKYAGEHNDHMDQGEWLSHEHPPGAPVARSVTGITLAEKRFIFCLDDGRTGELHLSGLGGEGVSPILRSTSAKRTLGLSTNYEWSILEAPESEGGNAAYCTMARGPSHCIEGVKETHNRDIQTAHMNFQTKKKTIPKNRAQKSNLISGDIVHGKDDIYNRKSPWVLKNLGLFQMRTMQFGKSIFLISDDGNVFERFYNEGDWIWLKHEHSKRIIGILGIYNGTIFATDVDGNLLMRERVGDNLQWTDCSTVGWGYNIVSGPPWDGILGELRKVTINDALSFVDSKGNLVEFTVALHNFQGHNYSHPPKTSIACILDQEVLRYRLIFVVGDDGKLYHFNRVTKLWHSYSQPPNIILSKIPGTVIRKTYESLIGSLFMRSEAGSLIEFQWDIVDGWKWTDHGLPDDEIVLATSPGPSFGTGRVFIIGSNGHVFSRYLVGDHWKWADHKYPPPEAALLVPQLHVQSEKHLDEIVDAETAEQKEAELPRFVQSNLNLQGVNFYVSFSGLCKPKVAPVRPVAFSKSSVVFTLKDGRLAELKKTHEDLWNWTHIADSPGSSCQTNYWTTSNS